MSTALDTAGRAAVQTLAIACASLALAGAAQAQHHGGGFRGGGGHVVHGGGGHHHGGHHHGGYRHGGSGWVWGGLGLGLGLGLANYYSTYPWYVVDPGYVVVDPPVVYENVRPIYGTPVPARSARPVIYPRNGQSAERTDADANACSEWAGQQPNATTDAGVFQRGIAACMDARGYTLR